MGKFFTVDIKPTITASKQHLGAFDDGDVLFDWTAFNIPKGAARLLDAAFIIRGTEGAAQTFASTLLFAKTINGVAPDGLGTIHATADGFGHNKNLLHVLESEESHFMGTGLDLYSYVPFIFGDGALKTTVLRQPVLQGEPDSGSNVGYDRLYISAITNDGTANFSTAIETTAAEDISELGTAIIGGTSALDNGSGGAPVCQKKFDVGDIIHAEDDIILGEIASLTTNTITFRHDGVKQYHAGGEVLYDTPISLEDWKKQNGDGAADMDLADGDELYNVHPITVRLSFER